MRTKSIRYNAAQDESLMIQSGKPFFETCKGKRRSDYFKNDNPIVLELACGRGEYTVGLSQVYPDKNFIGIDIKWERMMQWVKKYKKLQTSPQPDITPTPLLTERGYSTIWKWWYLHTLAKHNRKNMTSEEEYMWNILRDRQIEWIKFRRQHPIQWYIADFYCAAYKLIVEIDGWYHTTVPQQEYDTIRDELLIKNWYIILRCTNEEINNSIETVLDKILASCGHPSPGKDEGTGVRYARGWNLMKVWIHSRKYNIAFLRTIIHHLDQFFAPEEVDEIWIVHPDPRSKWHDERRRLTSPRFLRMYYQMLKPGWLLRLKTDDDGLFDYSVESLDLRSDADIGARVMKELPPRTEQSGHFLLQESTYDLYGSPLLWNHHGIRTHYEEIFVEQGRTVKYGIWKKI